MIIRDRIYGKVKIESPVLIELVKSKPLIYENFSLLEDSKIIRLSEIDENFKMLLEKAREKNKKGIKIPRLSCRDHINNE